MINPSDGTVTYYNSPDFGIIKRSKDFYNISAYFFFRNSFIIYIYIIDTDTKIKLIYDNIAFFFYL